MDTLCLPSLRRSQRYAKSVVMPTDQVTPKRTLTPAAERALAEAAARRAAQDRDKETQSREVAGRGGLDPTRYGDWEINGLASDF
jgi:hypothetical protein